MEKTVKMRAYSEEAPSDASQGNPADDQNRTLELALKDAQLEEEKSKTLEYLKTIVQLRENLKQEQAKAAEVVKKSAELEAKVKDLAALDSTEFAKKNAQLEEERRKSLEQMKAIEQLKETLRQEQAKAAEQEAKAKGSAVQEAKVKELTEALGKIAAIAAAGKAG